MKIEDEHLNSHTTIAKTDIENTQDSNAIGVVVQCPCSAFHAELRRIERRLDCAGASEAMDFDAWACDLENGYAWETVWQRITDRYQNTGNDDLLERIRKVLPNI